MRSGILSVDIGGSGLKATVIDEEGQVLAERMRVPTPHPCPPALLLEKVVAMAEALPAFNRISIGFPGVIRNGKVQTAVNLGSDSWLGFALADELSARLGGRPAKLLNDADMQGYGLVSGHGLEFVVTLGTGIGTAWFKEGELLPHMELAHHPIHGGASYENYLGEAALESIGKKHWNKRLGKALNLISIIFRPDRVFIGGGNVRHVELKLPEFVILGSNLAGLKGGAALWKKAGTPKP